jgi:hypothetical protein
MIHVQMAQQNPPDLCGVYTGTLHGDQGGCTAVDENMTIRPTEQKTGLKASSTPEGIARPEKLQLNLAHSLLF